MPYSWAENSISVHDDYEFYMEYPQSWMYTDSWEDDSSIIWTSPNSEYSVKVSLQDHYVLVTRSGLQKIVLDSVNQTVLKDISDSIQKACRDNTYQSCWNYIQLDAGLAGDKPAILLGCSATINEKNSIVYQMVVPDGGDIWIVEVYASKDRYEDIELV